MSFGGQPGMGGMGGGGGQMEMFQAQVAFKLMNGAISGCFSDCATDFRSPKMTDSEQVCVKNCTARYFASTQLMGKMEGAQGQGGF